AVVAPASGLTGGRNGRTEGRETSPNARPRVPAYARMNKRAGWLAKRKGTTGTFVLPVASYAAMVLAATLFGLG
ncbi:MAG: hypothetical protein ACT4PT_02310, partial [Methanobacteriota archaeon]